MFDESSVGMRVVSDFFGKGVITCFESYPPPLVGVMFDSVKYQFEYTQLKTMPDCYFNVDGTLCGMVEVAEYSISSIRQVVVGKRSSLDELI